MGPTTVPTTLTSYLPTTFDHYADNIINELIKQLEEERNARMQLEVKLDEQISYTETLENAGENTLLMVTNLKLEMKKLKEAVLMKSDVLNSGLGSGSGAGSDTLEDNPIARISDLYD